MAVLEHYNNLLIETYLYGFDLLIVMIVETLLVLKWFPTNMKSYRMMLSLHSHWCYHGQLAQNHGLLAQNHVKGRL